jgi:hypothetical protein
MSREMKVVLTVNLFVLSLFGLQIASTDRGGTSYGQIEPSPAARTPVGVFLELTGDNAATRSAALKHIGRNWNDGDSAMLIESARFVRDRGARASIYRALSEYTGRTLGTDHNEWFRWLWNQDVDVHPNYATFKSRLYARIDPRFAEYFDDSFDATIRLDEVRWGGVRRDGIPPLNNPETIPASEATYLADTDLVFGVTFGGQARAYPKRILAWHEMVKDNVGGRSINGVYCTLCGAMIVYDPEAHDPKASDPKAGGKHYELGTSGFLYRSNKLMYDQETKSMWSTLRGVPVVGPLVGKGIKLKSLHVVTTTWGKWKTLHPDTDVLSLRTGHRRDYGEGVAYKSYFATDELMFTVPKLDTRLKNKDEVLVIRADGDEHLAIAIEFLKTRKVYHGAIEGKPFVVLTDETGAHRVYESGIVRFLKWEDPSTVVTDDGIPWRVTEDALVLVAALGRADSKRFRRLSAYRAFWFGWNAAFPDGRLIKSPQ